MASTSNRVSVALLCAAVVTAWPSAKAWPAARASAAPTAERRALLRCRTVLEREAVSFTNMLGFRLGRCLRPLGECSVAPAPAGCTSPTVACASLESDVGALQSRFHDRLVSACAGLSVDRLVNDLGYRTVMPECTADSLEAFVRCLIDGLRSAEGRMVVALEPATCDLLAKAGVAAALPPDVCAPPAQCNPAPPPDSPLYCGGPSAVACPDDLACDRTDALCTQPAAVGQCVIVPPTCTDQGAPVCGCDGQTYTSDCERVKAGVVLARAGACDPPPVACGTGQPACAAGFYCDFPRGDCGEGQPGVCRPERDTPCNLCTAFVGGPVCGCDLVTYATECARAAAGVSKLFDGSCS